MKNGSIIFLKTVVVFIGIAALAVMVRFPLSEGGAVNKDLLSIYLDPFIIYGYLASIPFFVVLYQAFRLLGYIDQDKIFSQDSVDALRTIKYCSIALSILIVMAAVYIRLFHAQDDDPAGFIAICLFTTFSSIVVGTVATVLKRILQNSLNIKP
jgi:hypothetical protein